MQTATPSSRSLSHARTLALGAVLAAGIGMTGGADLSWLGFALAAMHTGAPGGPCRRRPAS